MSNRKKAGENAFRKNLISHTFEQLVTFVKNEYRSAHVLPPGHQIFHIFNACPFEKVKVVILGQDPYPNPGNITESASPSRKEFPFLDHWPTYSKRNTPRLRQTDPHIRQSGPLGRARRVSYELGPDCTGSRNRLTSEYGMGNFYRCSDKEIERWT